MGSSYIPPRDSTGRPIMRAAATIKGWHYQAMSFEITSTTGVFFCEDADGNDCSGDFTVVYSSTEVSVTWAPTHDYEVVSGNIHLGSQPAGSMRIWALGGAVDLGAAGTKEFVSGVRLDKVQGELKTDGRASKYMNYTTEGVPVPTNKFKFILKHDANLTHTVNIVMEIFKE